MIHFAYGDSSMSNPAICPICKLPVPFTQSRIENRHAVIHGACYIAYPEWANHELRIHDRAGAASPRGVGGPRRDPRLGHLDIPEPVGGRPAPDTSGIPKTDNRTLRSAEPGSSIGSPSGSPKAFVASSHDMDVWGVVDDSREQPKRAGTSQQEDSGSSEVGVELSPLI